MAAYTRVERLLAKVDLLNYLEVFREHSIDDSVLADLTDEELRSELGVSVLGHRKKLLRAIHAQEYFEEHDENEPVDEFYGIDDISPANGEVPPPLVLPATMASSAPKLRAPVDYPNFSEPQHDRYGPANYPWQPRPANPGGGDIPAGAAGPAIYGGLSSGATIVPLTPGQSSYICINKKLEDIVHRCISGPSVEVKLVPTGFAVTADNRKDLEKTADTLSRWVRFNIYNHTTAPLPNSFIQLWRLYGAKVLKSKELPKSVVTRVVDSSSTIEIYAHSLETLEAARIAFGQIFNQDFTNVVLPIYSSLGDILITKDFDWQKFVRTTESVATLSARNNEIQFSSLSRDGARAAAEKLLKVVPPRNAQEVNLVALPNVQQLALNIRHSGQGPVSELEKLLTQQEAALQSRSGRPHRAKNDPQYYIDMNKFRGPHNKPFVPGGMPVKNPQQMLEQQYAPPSLGGIRPHDRSGGGGWTPQPAGVTPGQPQGYGGPRGGGGWQHHQQQDQFHGRGGQRGAYQGQYHGPPWMNGPDLRSNEYKPIYSNRIGHSNEPSFGFKLYVAGLPEEDGVDILLHAALSPYGKISSFTCPPRRNWAFVDMAEPRFKLETILVQIQSNLIFIFGTQIRVEEKHSLAQKQALHANKAWAGGRSHSESPTPMPADLTSTTKSISETPHPDDTTGAGEVPPPRRPRKEPPPKWNPDRDSFRHGYLANLYSNSRATRGGQRGNSRAWVAQSIRAPNAVRRLISQQKLDVPDDVVIDFHLEVIDDQEEFARIDVQGPEFKVSQLKVEMNQLKSHFHAAGAAAPMGLSYEDEPPSPQRFPDDDNRSLLLSYDAVEGYDQVVAGIGDYSFEGAGVGPEVLPALKPTPLPLDLELIPHDYQLKMQKAAIQAAKQDPQPDDGNPVEGADREVGFLAVDSLLHPEFQVTEGKPQTIL